MSPDIYLWENTMNHQELRNYMMSEGAISFIRALNEFIPERPIDPKKTHEDNLFEGGRRALVLQLNRMLEER
jgi:hypothetical protein